MSAIILLRRLALAAVLSAAAWSPSWADPPARVGRISYVEGSVALHSQDQWSAASINFPVIPGDAVWTEPGARAELQMGPAEIRIDQASEFDILRLDDEATVVRVDQGEVNLHLLVMPPGGLQVITAAGQVDLLAPGRYHVDVGRPAAPGPVAVGVLEGAARLAGPRGAVELRAGQGALVPADLSTMTMVGVQPTPIDAWALERQQAEQAATSMPYLSPDMTGYQDLGGYGQWTSLPDVGPVWIPSAVPADWAPYRYGHWAYVQPWGWTWIDDAPWGFAPFHYGRWVDLGGRWAWSPGERVARPVYAPALVVFLGDPGAVVVGVGRPRPAVGWVPLAPHEPFHPYYRASEVYMRRIDVGHDGGRREADHRPPGDWANRHAVTMVPVGVPAGPPAGAPPHHERQGSPDEIHRGGRPGAGPAPAALPTPVPQPQARPVPQPAAPAPQAQPVLQAPPHMPQPTAPQPMAQPHPQPQPVPQALPQPAPQVHPQSMPQTAAPHPMPQASPGAAAPAAAASHPQGQSGHDHEHRGKDSNEGDRH